ncbi:GNAT family N-acetyltransferase [Companilactobacillus sp. DQM5]|uniref:GNAT family N-acetyltransferase n=1 Tax=Companilactobacillus sp. DQM5 TaxID=3463359 RepID=UPI0040597814
MIIKMTQIDEYVQTQELVKSAFENAEHSGDEYILIQNLRKETNYIPELDLVAVENKEIIGHVMLTPIKIGTYKKGLCLAPLSVKSSFQKRGIGKELINYSENKALKLGYTAIHILGDPKFYGKFGYEPASKFNIRPSYSVNEKYFMIKELKKNALQNISGEIEYQKSFGI